MYIILLYPKAAMMITSKSQPCQIGKRASRHQISLGYNFLSVYSSTQANKKKKKFINKLKLRATHINIIKYPVDFVNTTVPPKASGMEENTHDLLKESFMNSGSYHTFSKLFQCCTGHDVLVSICCVL